MPLVWSESMIEHIAAKFIMRRLSSRDIVIVSAAGEAKLYSVQM